jgi:hypothetical protein
VRGRSAFRGGRRANRVDEQRRAVAQEVLHGKPRLGQNVDGAAGKRFDRDRRVLAGARGADDHGNRVGRHEAGQEREAVHARHFDVEDDYLGPLQRDASLGDEGVRGERDREFPGLLEQLLQGLADQGRVVDDEDVDHERPPEGLR